MEDLTPINIRLEIYEEGHPKFDSRFVLLMYLSETLKHIKERIQRWHPDALHLIGYETPDGEETPLYDEDVTIASVYDKEKTVLIFSSIVGER